MASEQSERAYLTGRFFEVLAETCDWFSRLSDSQQKSAVQDLDESLKWVLSHYPFEHDK